MSATATLPATIPSSNNPDLLDVREAAAFVGVAKHTLDVWRVTGKYSLPFLRCGRKIKYRRRDLEEWLESRRVSG